MASRKREHLSLVPSIQHRVEVFLKGAGDMRLESDVTDVLRSVMHEMSGPWPDEAEIKDLALVELERAVHGFSDRLDASGTANLADMRLVDDWEANRLAKRFDDSLSANAADVRRERMGARVSLWCSSAASDEALDRTSFSGQTWMDGGASLLAHALRMNEPEAMLVGIEVDGNVEHVGALLDGFVYDALGVHDPAEWAVSWGEHEQRSDELESARIVDLDDGVRLPRELQVGRKDAMIVAAELQERLGNPVLGFDFFSADDVFGDEVTSDDGAQLSESRQVFRSASRGDIVSVGKSRWVIMRPLGDIQALAFKHPSKHRDLFEIFLGSDDDGDVVVMKVDGSANRVGSAVATGPLRSTGERLEMDGYVAPTPSKAPRSQKRGERCRRNPDVLYHVTSFDAVERIANEGLKPRKGSGVYSHGGYGEHSQGKVFLAEGRDAALAWYGRIQDMLWHEHSDDEEPDQLVPVMLRVDLSSTKLREVIDPVGDRDISGSYFVTGVVPPDAIEFFDPSKQEWTPIEECDINVYQGISDIEYYDEDGNAVDEDETDEFGEQLWRTRGFTVFGPYDDGGFKPPSDDSAAW